MAARALRRSRHFSSYAALSAGVLALQSLWLHATHDKQQAFLCWLRDRGELQIDPDPQRREELTLRAFESLPPEEQRHLVEEEERRRLAKREQTGPHRRGCENPCPSITTTSGSDFTFAKTRSSRRHTRAACRGLGRYAASVDGTVIRAGCGR